MFGSDIGYVEIALLLVAAVYLGAPLLIRFKVTKPLESTLRVMNPVDEPLPVSVQKTMSEKHPALEALGFLDVFYATWDGEVEGQEMYVLVYRNEDTRDMAGIFVSPHPVPVAYVEFTARLAAEGSVNTNNNPIFVSNSMYAPEKHVYSYPEIDDTAELFAAHTALCGSAGGGKQPLPNSGMLDTIRDEIRTDLEYLAGKAYFYRDETGRVFRPTLKGAYLMTWRLMWPFKPILQWLQKSRVRAALRDAPGGAALLRVSGVNRL